jgi:hypothetical protein
MMIARLWHGRVPEKKDREFLLEFEPTVRHDEVVGQA